MWLWQSQDSGPLACITPLPPGTHTLSHSHPGLHCVDSRASGWTLAVRQSSHDLPLPPGPEAAVDGPADATGQ